MAPAAGADSTSADSVDMATGCHGRELGCHEHMNAANEALGYRRIETLLELQKRL